MLLASYISTRPGIAGIFNRFVRAILLADESHSELVFSDGKAFSCSWLDKGPRFKTIQWNPDHWVFTNISDIYNEEEVRKKAEYICEHKTIKYSLLLLIAQLFPFLLRWVPDNGEMCSSAIALVLNIKEHKRYEPHELRLALQNLG